MKLNTNNLMKRKSYYKFLLKTPLFLLTFFIFSNIPYLITNKAQSKPTIDYFNRKTTEEYILGEGDKLKINFGDDLEFLDDEFDIDANGNINLPKLKSIYVSGLTIQELENLLNIKLREFIISPQIKIEVLSYRPIRIMVEGEVEDPGMYVLPGSISPDQIKDGPINLSTVNVNQGRSSYYYPSLFDAIKKAGGITNNADISSVEITRLDTLTNGGSRKKTTVNFLDVLLNKNLSNNLRLFDGDTIDIPRFTSKKINMKVIAKSNLNPKFITVNVTGKVEYPGLIKLPRSATLNQGIKIAGGVKVLPGPVQFIRFKNDGTTESRKFNYSPNASPGSFKNPYLKNDDIINLNKSTFNKVTALLNEISSPITTSYILFNVFD